jgi:hypothetical protein
MVASLDVIYTEIWMFTLLGVFFLLLSLFLHFRKTSYEPTLVVDNEEGSAGFAPKVQRQTEYERFSMVLFSAIGVPIWISVFWLWLVYGGIYNMVSLIFFALLVFSAIMTFISGIEVFASSASGEES